MRGVSWVNVGLGLWIAVSAAVLQLNAALARSDVLIGILGVGVAVWSLRAAATNHIPAWLSLAVGFWVMVSPWALDSPPDPVVFASNAISGAVMVIFATVRSVGSHTHATV
jgi:hypothetical protein